MLRTTGQVNPENKLIIFEFFEVDKKLPKHRNAQIAANQSGLFVGGIPGIFSQDESDEGEENPTEKRFFWGRKVRGQEAPKSLWQRFLGFFKAPVEAPVTIETVFNNIKMSQQELFHWGERNQPLQEMLDKAKKTGQTTLLKRLQSEAGIQQLENVLFVKGYKKYISEKQLLEFVSKCEKGLCLDWVSYFTRVIPAEVVAKKVECDGFEIFDNYVVLHYDPLNKATTEKDRIAQAAKIKDPILFGVIEGSRKLYYIGDWQDEYCTLTLDEIIQKLGVSLEMPEKLGLTA